MHWSIGPIAVPPVVVASAVNATTTSIVLGARRMHRDKPGKHAQWLGALKALREITGFAAERQKT